VQKVASRHNSAIEHNPYNKKFLGKDATFSVLRASIRQTDLKKGERLFVQISQAMSKKLYADVTKLCFIAYQQASSTDGTGWHSITVNENWCLNL
jgi:hypothetical protein